MERILFLGLLVILPFAYSVKQVCFADYGCFTLDYPWWSAERPFSVLPDGPEKVRTRFLLHTRDETEEVELLINKTQVLNLSDFKSSRDKTYIIIHGFLDKPYGTWMQRMKDELLSNNDCNVILVDWSKGSGLPYMQATANSRLVGAQVAQLAEFFNRETGLKYENIHIIGHSLGAHIAGYAGNRLKTLGRITGLDPTSPYFQGAEPLVRLDSEDAQFVDSIHTDGNSLLYLGFGMTDSVGHIDFYPNGGKDQPGCKHDLLSKITGSIWNILHINVIGAKQAVACSHLRAAELFIESINTECPLLAFPCADYDGFLNNNCQRCDHGQCSRLGFHSNEFKGRGKMYLTTNDVTPFCQHFQLVELTTSTSQKPAIGVMKVKLIGRSGKSGTFQIYSNSNKIYPSSSYVGTATTNYDISDIKEVQVTYEDKAFLFHDELIVDKIIIRVRNNKLEPIEYKFCANAVHVKHSRTVSIQDRCKDE